MKCIYLGWLVAATFLLPVPAKAANISSEELVEIIMIATETPQDRELRLQPKTIKQSVTTYEDKPVYGQVRYCNGKQCWYERIITGYKSVPVQKIVEIQTKRAVLPEAAPTPLIEVHRILALLKPKKTETLVDFGCGDARFLIAAVKKYGCKGLGIEIDIERAALAQHLVDKSGVGNRITIVHGDSTELNIKADVGVAYLYQGTLKKLRPAIKKLDRFASYRHEVEGLKMSRYGSAYVWKKPEPPKQCLAVWNGNQYAGPVCNQRGCAMCNSIRNQLGY